ncbi:MAG: metallophosphoesterase family protein [Pseudomarimonas sp.]
MRLLLTSDLHYRLPLYDWLMQAASGFDAVAIAGDHIDGGQPVPAYIQIKAIRASLSAISEQRPLFVCSGNHDLNARDPAGEKYASWVQECRSAALAVDGDSVLLGDTLITVCPWWDGPAGRKSVSALLDSASVQRGARWVWLYHAPPQGKLSWTGKRHYGDALLPELIARHAPTAVLCGHIHEAPFQMDGSWHERIGETWLFNAGRQSGNVPARVEIDFAAGHARWVTTDGVEECLLSTQAA